jgi:hypothetical protein
MQNINKVGYSLYPPHLIISGGRVGKKAGNTHISQDGGKYWYFPGNTGK